MIRRLSKGDSRLANGNRRVLLSVLSLTNSHCVRRFGREGLSKAATMFRKRQGNIDLTKKTAEAGGAWSQPDSVWGFRLLEKSRRGQLG